MSKVFFFLCVLLAAVVVRPATASKSSGAAGTGVTPKADFVFIVDCTSSMGDEIAAVKNGLAAFVAGLQGANIDARFAIVLMGGAPELVLDFTANAADTQTAFGKIALAAVPGFSENHNVNPEAGLEAIRMTLGASTELLLHQFVGGDGKLHYRPDAVKNLILVTDEDSDKPFYAANTFPGQTGTEPPAFPNATWQQEVDATAQAVIANNAFVNMLVNVGDAPVAHQFGNPASSVSDPDFLNFDPQATLTNLINGGFGNCLEAQVLNAGLIGRAFNITQVNTPNFINNFFAAKIEEVQEANIPPVFVDTPGSTCGTAPSLKVQAGAPFAFSVKATAPELDQLTFLSSVQPGFVTVNIVQVGEAAIANVVINATLAQVGQSFSIKFTAVDNGTPPLTSNYEVCFGVEGPLAVDLLTFQAQWTTDGKAALVWETGAEIDNAGFNLYRMVRAQGGPQDVNVALIPAEGGPSQGASYLYLDGAAVKGALNFYWLEAVDLFGVSKLYGPVTLNVPQ